MPTIEKRNNSYRITVSAGYDLQGKQIDDVGRIGDAGSLKGLGDRVGNTGNVKIHTITVTLEDLVHGVFSSHCLFL